MSIKTVSTRLELRVLRTMTTTNNKRKLAKLADTLNPACFYTDIGKEIYQRVMRIARERSVIIKWDELIHDPAISESTRRYMQNFRHKPTRSFDALNGQVTQLHNLRRLRSIFFAMDYASKEFRKDRVDIDKFVSTVNDYLIEARTSGDTQDWFVHIGKTDKEARKLAKEILDSKVHKSYLPTGIPAFDQRNVGIPRGSFFMMASTTSGGKSVVANQVAGNMAESGLRVCLVELEMSKLETGQRQMSRINRVNMQRIIDPRRMSRRSKRRSYANFMRYHRRIKQNNGLLTICTPGEDIDAESLLFLLRPMDYDIIIIDYIGLLKGADEQDYPRLLGKVARFGKRFASINNMVVAACAQLSEENVLRYSRAMQEHAQNLWIWNYADPEARDAKIITVKQPKSRNQAGFTFYLKEDFAHMRVLPLNEKEFQSFQRRKKSSTTRHKTSTRSAPGRQNKFAGENQRFLDEDDFVQKRRST